SSPSSPCLPPRVSPPPRVSLVPDGDGEGGSHYLIMDQISRSLASRGHNVTMFVQTGTPSVLGLDQLAGNRTYRVLPWSMGEDYSDEYHAWFHTSMKEFFKGRNHVAGFRAFYGHMARQCDVILSDAGAMAAMARVRPHVAVLDAFNPCSFVLARALGARSVAVQPDGFPRRGQPPGLPDAPGDDPGAGGGGDGGGGGAGGFVDGLRDDAMGSGGGEGHSGARLLVSHGGMNSVYEAIYHGVPAVMIPLFGDQHRNCRLAQSRGFAVCLRVASLDRDALHSALHGALQEPRLRVAARAASALHRSLPMSPGATLSRWLEHVTAVGGAEHLRPRAATAAAAGAGGGGADGALGAVSASPRGRWLAETPDVAQLPAPTN
ncbi:UDP-glucuronosyltransferase 3A1-like, partial [Lampetra planeri]